MNSVISIVSSLIGPTQLGGWVRAGVAALGGYLAVKYGMQYWNDPEVIGALGTAASAIVVGLWSSLSKVTAPVTTTPAPSA